MNLNPNMSPAELVTRFVTICLDDDDGISENAYNTLLDLFNAVLDEDGWKQVGSDLERIIRNVRATDGRFYLPIDDES